MGKETVAITGASSGIGEVLAKKLATTLTKQGIEVDVLVNCAGVLEPALRVMPFVCPER